MRGRTWQMRVLAGTLFLAGTVTAVSAQTPPAPVAMVNGQPITLAEFQVMMDTVRTPVELPADRKKMIQMEALSMMIDELLMTQFLARTVPPPSPAEVEVKLGEFIEGLKKENKSFGDFLKEAKTTEANFRRDLAVRVQWNNYARSRINDAEALRYYQENKDFFDGVTVRVSHIVIRLPRAASEADRDKARATLTQLRGNLLAGKIDFAQAAKTYSMCESSSRGGDLGLIPRKGLIDENFARVAFSLQVGQVSEVVETEFGMHLILVTERKPGTPSDFTKIKEDVRLICMGELWQQVLAEQRKTAKIDIHLP